MLCLSTIPFAFIGASTSIVAISLVLVVRGVGIGFSFMPAMTAAFASLRPDQLSDATPQLNVLQRVGGAIGTAVLAVVLQRASGHAPSVTHLAHAFNTAYWWSLGIGALGADPVRRAAARRESARPAEPRGRQRRGSRRAARRVGEARWPPPRPPATGKRRHASRATRAELTELGKAFRRVFRSLSRLRGRDTHLGGSELSHAQFELLIELDERGELSAGELAAAARLTPATVTQMLDHLAERGHVERVRFGDRPAGGRLASDPPGPAQDRGQARGLARRRWDEALEDVDAKDLRAATRVLEAARRDVRGCLARGRPARLRRRARRRALKGLQ